VPLLLASALIDVYATVRIAELSVGIAHNFQNRPGETLLDLIELAASAQRKAMRLRATDAIAADEMHDLSSRLQLAAAACLSCLGTLKDVLGRCRHRHGPSHGPPLAPQRVLASQPWWVRGTRGRYEVDQILLSRRGFAALDAALRFECKVFLAQPLVQAFVCREWRGPLLDSLYVRERPSSELLLRALVALIAIAVNTLLLPIVSLVPLLETLVFECLADSQVPPHAASS
jgi:hypothetical protein